MKTKKDIVVDGLFLLSLAATITVLIVSATGTNKANATQEPMQEPSSEPTTAFYEEVIINDTEEEIEVTETTEPEVTLYNVPLDVSLQQHIIKKAEEYGIDPAIIVAMCWKESTFNEKCIGDNGNSFGLLQVQVKWHYERMLKLGCTDLLDPYQNVTVAIDYLCELLNRYGSIDKALTAYNRGSYSGTVTEYAKTIMNYAEGLVN